MPRPVSGRTTCSISDRDHLASLTRARLTARWSIQMMSHPMLPYSYTTVSAPPRLFELSTGHPRRLKPAFAWMHPDDEAPVAVREDVVGRSRSAACAFRARPEIAAPRSMCWWWRVSGHHATLLRGTVETLLPTHEVYITTD